ncbi:hypothetical protein [Pseudooceanicola sp.]|jgi:hypothetical protein|uniref:hypothetical protein n=1 Tax=Pseudooceanicola sp. TaxID=1914328 RepID=UPI004057E3F3
MPESHDANVVKMYEGALRALDTKAQIFLAFLTITMNSAYARLLSLDLPAPIRVAEVVLFLSSVLCFIVCLYPRRGKRSANGLFDTGISGAQLLALMERNGDAMDLSSNVAVLHEIYRVKVRSVALGIVLIALYAASVALAYAVS